MQETPHYNTEISQKDIFQEKKKKSRIPTNYLQVKRKQRSYVNLENSKLIKYPPPSF